VSEFGFDLQRVIPINRALGDDFLIVSVELYDAGVVVRWVGLPQAEDPGRWEPPRLELHDDCATEYRPSGSAWSGHVTARGETAFIPEVPDKASALQVMSPDGESVDVQVAASV
jgi:hypothetical protein